MFFSSNIKFLRKRHFRTQDDVAATLGMKRSTLSGYENNIAQPNMEALVAFSNHFKIAIDTLIRVDLSKMLESQLYQLEHGYDVYIRGNNLRILATTVNQENRENIELVPEKAKAGYKTGFADPEYIRILPAFHLPFLSRDRKYRTFQIEGDSMLPIPHGSWVTGEYTENWENIRNRHAYIILTQEDGIIFKVAENRIREEKKLILYSLNTAYEPFGIDIRDVKEVWKFVNYISSEMPEPNLKKEELIEEVKELRREIRAIQTKLDL